MSIQALDNEGQIVRYTDRRRWLWSLSLLWPLLPVVSSLLAARTGHAAWYWATWAIWYLIVPVIDHLLPADASNPPPEVVPQLDADRYYRLLPMLTVPIHYLTLIYCAWVIGTGDLAWYSILGLALSVGLVNGIAINTGHELGHKTTTLERWLAKTVLAVVGYGHFFIEHNKGHHKDVATPDDPASSRMGENIYGFACREIPGCHAPRLGFGKDPSGPQRQRARGPCRTKCCSRC